MPRERRETAPAFPALPPSMAVAWMREAAHLHGVCRESGEYFCRSGFSPTCRPKWRPTIDDNSRHDDSERIT